MWCRVAVIAHLPPRPQKGRALACLNCGLLRLAAGHMRMPLRPGCKCEANRRHILHVPPRNALLLSPAAAGAGRIEVSPRACWGGESGEPSQSAPPRRLFLRWGGGRARGWIMCEPHCSCGLKGGCEPGFVTNPSPRLPMVLYLDLKCRLTWLMSTLEINSEIGAALGMLYFYSCEDFRWCNTVLGPLPLFLIVHSHFLFLLRPIRSLPPAYCYGGFTGVNDLTLCFHISCFWGRSTQAHWWKFRSFIFLCTLSLLANSSPSPSPSSAPLLPNLLLSAGWFFLVSLVLLKVSPCWKVVCSCCAYPGGGGGFSLSVSASPWNSLIVKAAT